MNTETTAGIEDCQNIDAETELESISSAYQKIDGFDTGGKSFLREPTLYLSILGLFIACSVTLTKTPTAFWITFASFSAVIVILHIIAERYLFKQKKENTNLDAPFEGSFIATFGALLPGAGLLGYSINTLYSSPPPLQNIPSEICKIALLLLVPICNFLVWKTIRKRYIKRPRLTGMMNGIALGLSSTWTIVLAKTVTAHGAGPCCKFGWMFLLCASPFLLIAAVMLLLDLNTKTEKHISKITSAFAGIGFVLSSFFAFTPAIHKITAEAAINEARTATSDKRGDCIANMAAVATPEDLRPSDNPVDGFGLTSMLVGTNSGVENNNDIDKEIFFRLTGKPFNEPGHPMYNPLTWKPEEESNTSWLIGSRINGLAMNNAQITGLIDTNSLTSTLNWSMTISNQNASGADARAEITLPPGTVLTNCQIRINDRLQQINLIRKETKNATIKTPVVLCTAGRDKVILKHVEIPNGDGEARISLMLRVPLITANTEATVMLPMINQSNFEIPKRLRLHLRSNNKFVVNGVRSKGSKNYFVLDDMLKTETQAEIASYPIKVRTSPAFHSVAVKDPSNKTQFIVERALTTVNEGPKRLSVVIDNSETLKQYTPELRELLTNLPNDLEPAIYFTRPIKSEQADLTDGSKGTTDATEESNPAKPQADSNKVPIDKTEVPIDKIEVSNENESVKSDANTNNSITAMNRQQALKELSPSMFSGGLDNSATLREAIETSAEKANAAILWIHGPQPLIFTAPSSSPLDLMHSIKVFDFSIQNGPNKVPAALRLGIPTVNRACSFSQVVRNSSVQDDLQSLISSWRSSKPITRIVRETAKSPGAAELIESSDVAEQVSALWAMDQYKELLESGQTDKAVSLAMQYKILTPETEFNYALKTAQALYPGHYEVKPAEERISYVGNAQFKTRAQENPVIVGGESEESSNLNSAQTGSGPGLIGAPVDPRYGQCNEVGSLADYGYDQARDISRICTALATLLVALFCAPLAVRYWTDNKKLKALRTIGLSLAVPTIVHIFGTFMINNFGGLGGGL